MTISIIRTQQVLSTSDAQAWEATRGDRTSSLVLRGATQTGPLGTSEARHGDAKAIKTKTLITHRPIQSPMKNLRPRSSALPLRYISKVQRLERPVVSGATSGYVRSTVRFPGHASVSVSQNITGPHPFLSCLQDE